MANTQKNEIIQLSLSYSAVLKNPVEGEDNVHLSDSITLSFGNEHETDQHLKQKPHMAEILPRVITALLAAYDPEKTALARLKESTGIK